VVDAGRIVNEDFFASCENLRNFSDLPPLAEKWGQKHKCAFLPLIFGGHKRTQGNAEEVAGTVTNQAKALACDLDAGCGGFHSGLVDSVILPGFQIG
jgi:hypothetical protein